MNLHTGTAEQRPQVVIVGAGFGGLNCARALAGKPVDVVLIDRRNYHVFTPLLYQVATSLLNPSDVAVPVRTLFRKASNVTFYETDVSGFDLEAQRVQTVEDLEFPYDYLVIASGSTTFYYGKEPLAERAYGLKDLPEALELRNHIIRCFDHAARIMEEEDVERWLTFAVVGGGPTGVEYAGALGELIRLVMLKDYPELPRDKIRIVLVEAGKGLLAGFSEDVTEVTRKSLNRFGVEVILNDPVESYEHDTLKLKSGKTLVTETVVWAAGVKPSPLSERLSENRTRLGRVVVDPYLRVEGRDDVFAIGDIASLEQDGSELPMLAPPAMQQGRYIARAVLDRVRGKEPKPFRYRDRGVMAVIGRNRGIARIGRFVVNGFIGWVLWLVVHIYFLIGFRNRLSVFLYWAWNYVFYDRPVRIVIPQPKRTRRRQNARRKRAGRASSKTRH